MRLRGKVALAALMLVASPSLAMSARASATDIAACNQRALAYINAHNKAAMRYGQLLVADGGINPMSQRTCAALREAVTAGNAYVSWIEGKGRICALNQTFSSLTALQRQYQASCR